MAAYIGARLVQLLALLFIISLLTFVLSKPPDRVTYTNLMLRKPDFEEIERLGREAGILNGTAHFEDYTDASFVTDETAVQPYAWEPTLKK